MEYIVSASTDIGIKKKTNQDSLSVKMINSSAGKIVFAILCDGMGGLKKGEVASASVVEEFNLWVRNHLAAFIDGGFRAEDICEQWSAIVRKQNNKILSFGRNEGINLGTTVVAALFADSKYYIMNIGDSRAYRLESGISQITHDHTVVAREVEMGILDKDDALNDPRRNVLLQCIGASDDIEPEFYFGEVNENSVWILCSDGFVHEISENEMYEYLCPARMTGKEAMKQNVDFLIETNKSRMEKDNISVIAIRTVANM